KSAVRRPHGGGLIMIVTGAVAEMRAAELAHGLSVGEPDEKIVGRPAIEMFRAVGRVLDGSRIVGNLPGDGVLPRRRGRILDDAQLTLAAAAHGRKGLRDAGRLLLRVDRNRRKRGENESETLAHGGSAPRGRSQLGWMPAALTSAA